MLQFETVVTIVLLTAFCSVAFVQSFSTSSFQKFSHRHHHHHHHHRRWRSIAFQKIPVSLKKPSAVSRRAHNTNINKVEDGVSLSSLAEEDNVSSFLSDSIRIWLDEEFIPLEIHRVLGEEVGRIYTSRRQDGVTDLGEMMMDVGSALESIDIKEAFVNAWDVANKVSDLLFVKLDRELCSCSGDMTRFVALAASSDVGGDGGDGGDGMSRSKVGSGIASGTIGTGTEAAEQVEAEGNSAMGSVLERTAVDTGSAIGTTPMKPSSEPTPPQSSWPLHFTSPSTSSPSPRAISLHPDRLQLERAAKSLKSEFARYKLLRDFLDDEVSWADIHPAIALVLGFRVQSDGKIYQDYLLHPVGWKEVTLPDFSDGFWSPRMARDLPEDDGATDVVLETLAGMEMYQLMKASLDADVQRRILVCKWLYVHGFLNAPAFPFEDRYVPSHLSLEETGVKEELDEE